MLDWLDSFLVTGLFEVAMIIGLALLLHLQLGLTRIANFGVVGFWGLGYYAFGVLYIQVDWPFGIPGGSSCARPAPPRRRARRPAGRLADLRPRHRRGPGGHAGLRRRGPDRGHHRGRVDGRRASAWEGSASRSTWARSKEDELGWLVVLAWSSALIFLYARQVHRSPYGRLLIATGGNEALARSLGKSTYRTKLGLFAVTSAGMGLLGAMFGSMQRSSMSAGSAST